MKLLIALLSLSTYAANITLCSSGCDYTTLAAALAAASRGDTITATAGQTFEGCNRLPYKTAGSGYITIRSSRYKELPPPGTRITAAQTALMAKFQPSSNSCAILTASGEYRSVSSVNTTTDVITTDAQSFVAGEPIAFQSGTNLPSPLVSNTLYYVVGPTSTTFQLSLTPGGSVIDLGAGFSGTVYLNSAWASNNYKFVGIEIAKKTGQDTLYNLVEIGNANEYHRSGIPSNFIFDHSYIHGIRDENGPNICLFINARNVTVVDSEISACVNPGAESKAIAMVQAPGPILIQNNLLEAASINILTGGGYVSIPNAVNGDEGQITIQYNYIHKPFWMYYRAGTGGAGAPAGTCPNDNDNYYVNTSNGQMYKCAGTGSAWGTQACENGQYYRRTDVAQNCGAGACWSCGVSSIYATYGVYRGSGYNVKNLMEFKNNTNTVVQGNIYEGNWPESQGGQGVLLSSKVAQYNANSWVVVSNTRFQNNILRQSTQGIRTATEGGTTFGVNNSRIQMANNLLYKIGATDYPSISGTDARPLSFAGPCDNCDYNHNTVVSGVTGGTGVYFDTAPFSRPLLTNSIWYANLYGNLGDLGQPVSYYWGTGNITNSVAVDNIPSQGAPANFGAYATNGKWITAATTLFTSSSNFRLQSTSPYSASCSSGCDYTGTDGMDLGADIDAITGATGGAVAGGPWLGGSVQVVLGSTRAIIKYTAPDASACTVKLYTDVGRKTLSDDTATGGNQADTRTGNVTAGTSRQFVLGTVSALTASTQYWAVGTCGTSTFMQPIKTYAAGAGTYNITTKYSSALTGQYSSSADMSSPTAISSSSTHVVPIPTGAVRYYQRTSGPISALVAP